MAIWHGREDRAVPVDHAQWWAEHLTGAELKLLDGEGHISISSRRGAEVLLAAVEGL